MGVSTAVAEEPSEYLYALDWQHESFLYNPYLEKDPESGTISFYPDGSACNLLYWLVRHTSKNVIALTRNVCSIHINGTFYLIGSSSC
ncbi:DUF2716 domain-containing protein [Paenibacillus sp. 2RAB27]|uniref:DUF2716 domain-containing protein n=1 Tax=Paenibacillus sp. 2RAB27 TaxID=3232991 RepID=UPI003F9B591C